MSPSTHSSLYHAVQQAIRELNCQAGARLTWLEEQMDPYFAITMQESWRRSAPWQPEEDHTLHET